MPQDFYNMSPKHFSLMLNGHNDHKLETYKLVRLLMFTMVRLHGDNKSGPKTPEQLWPLEGDEDTSIINEQEYREIFNRFKNGNEQRAVND